MGTLWRSAHNFGASFIFTIGRRYRKQASDTTAAWRHVPLYHFADFEDFAEHRPHDCMLVGVELAGGAIELPAMNHPERVIYLLGAEDHGLPPDVLKKCQRLVVVPGAARCLNVSVAGSIVMYDRISRAA